MATTTPMEYSEWSPSYADLPMEIILLIFRYLDHPDLQVAGAACRRWREALLDPEFNWCTLVRFSKVCLSDRMSPAAFLLKSDRPYRHYYLEDVTFGQVDEVMQFIGRTAAEITFDSVDMSDKQFYRYMKLLPNLRALHITRCSPLFMSGSFLDNNDDRVTVDLSFSGIRHLSLCCNQYLSDAILLRITALIRGIETLDLSGCHIAYHNAVHRRFYPNDQSVSPSESILTFKFIMRVLLLHRPHLRELNFGHTMMGGPALNWLCEIEDGGLHLLRLRLSHCRQLNTLGVKTFLQTQPQLVVLDLSDTDCVNDGCLETIVTATPLLEELFIAGCCAVTNSGATLLGTLKRLRRLNISRCGGIDSEGLIRGIARAPNTVMRELEMSNLNVCVDCVNCIARNLTQLRVLNVGHCVNGIIDESVQCIIQHLRWLRSLSLEDCYKITDTALTGISITMIEVKPPTSRSLENFHPPPAGTLAERLGHHSSQQSMKISLRSKAEEEIVHDANRKRAMFAAYELNLIDEDVTEGYNIQQLRGLRTLNLRGCNKITDVSLKYGLRFTELRQLTLSNCQQISYVGMATMALNCPSIEELDLSECYNINDKAIQTITHKLKRLRALHLSGCTQLTDHSLDAILVNCHCLQTLSVYRCRRMYMDIEERLSELATLRNLNMDNMLTSMDNADVFRLKKRLDY